MDRACSDTCAHATTAKANVRESLRAKGTIRLFLCRTSSVQSIPSRISDIGVIVRKCTPIRTADSVEIVDDFAVFNRQLTHKFLATIHAGAVHIGKTEFSAFYA